MKKICFLTTSRADFGVMEQLIKDVINSKKFNVHLIVSGSHTEKIFGNTQKEIFEKKCFVKKIKVISKILCFYREMRLKFIIRLFSMLKNLYQLME